MSMDWDEKRFAASIRRQAEQDSAVGRRAFVTEHTARQMVCRYDWAPGFHGRRLVCVAGHRHAAGNASVILRSGSTLAEMQRLGLLTGEAFQQGKGGTDPKATPGAAGYTYRVKGMGGPSEGQLQNLRA
jgi:hypothetical protein